MKSKQWWEAPIKDDDGMCDWSSRLAIMKYLKFEGRTPHPFGLLTEAEQEVMRECCLERYDGIGGWTITDTCQHIPPSLTYRVRADFQPKYLYTCEHCGRDTDNPHLCNACLDNPKAFESKPAVGWVEYDINHGNFGRDGIRYYYTKDGQQFFLHERESTPYYGGVKYHGLDGWYFTYPANQSVEQHTRKPMKIRFWVES